MKFDWEEKDLEDVSDFINGLWTGKKPPFIKVGVIRNTNFTKDNRLDYTNIAYLDVERSQYLTRKLQPGDIILEKSGGGPSQPVGRVVVFDKKDGEFSFSNFTSVIRIKNVNQLDPYFLHKYLHFLYVNGVTEKMQNHTTGIRNLRFGDYKEIRIPIPPLSEQQHIVAILEKAFTAIDKAKANTQKNLQNAKEVFATLLNDVFSKPGEGWVEKEIREVCAIERKINNKRLLPYVGMEDIEAKTSRFLGSLEPQSVKSSSFYFGKDHILYGRLRPYLNKVMSPNFEGHCSTEILPIKANQLIDKDFLYYWFISDKTVSAIDKTSTGTRMPRANMDLVLQFKIPVPPFSKQRLIVAKLDKIAIETKNLASIYQRKLSDLEELKKSILQKAFNGEL